MYVGSLSCMLYYSCEDDNDAHAVVSPGFVASRGKAGDCHEALAAGFRAGFSRLLGN